MAETVVLSAQHGAPQAHVIERIDVVHSTLAVALAYYVLRVLLGYLWVAIVPPYGLMSRKRARRFDLYTLSMVNAGALTWLAFQQMAEGANASLRFNFQLMVLVLGYFVHDFWASREEWLNHPVDVFHHLLGMTLTGGLLFIQPAVIGRYIPMFALAELSTIFLNFMWFSRELDFGSSGFAAGSKYLFVLSFFLVRVVNLPYQTYHVYVNQRELIERYPLLLVVLLLLCGLQIYWFVLIVRKFLGHKVDGMEEKRRNSKSERKRE